MWFVVVSVLGLLPPILSAEPSIVGEVLIFELCGRDILPLLSRLSVSLGSHVSVLSFPCMISIFGVLPSVY